jgi:septal ring factor EnvC (AmiA/AmiB activator)
MSNPANRLQLSPEAGKVFTDMEARIARLEAERAVLREELSDVKEENYDLREELFDFKNANEEFVEQMEVTTYEAEYLKKEKKKNIKRCNELETSFAALQARTHSQAKATNLFMKEDELKAVAGAQQAGAVQTDPRGQTECQNIEMKDAVDEDTRPICHLMVADNCRRGRKCPYGRHPDNATL